jgi:acetyl esterase
VLGGDSAGGTLTIVTAMTLRDAPAEVPVQAQVVIYPATDYSRTYPSEREFASGRVLTAAGLRWYNAHYRADVHDWHASLLLGDLAGLPPAVVLTAELPCPPPSLWSVPRPARPAARSAKARRRPRDP